MKIKSFVGLNSSGNSYSLAEDSLPNEYDSVYFTLINQKYPYNEYYKGTFQNDKFTSALLSFSIEFFNKNKSCLDFSKFPMSTANMF